MKKVQGKNNGNYVWTSQAISKKIMMLVMENVWRRGKKKYIKSRSRDTRPMAMIISAICFPFMSASSQLSKEMYGLILRWYSLVKYNYNSTVAEIFILKKTRVSMWTRCSLNSPRDDYAAILTKKKKMIMQLQGFLDLSNSTGSYSVASFLINRS